jgi:tetratricopeptide (TPR) repeat protein
MNKSDKVNNQGLPPAEPAQLLTTQKSIDLAVRHHEAGDFSIAKGIYQKILQADPNQPVALHLLGVIAHQVGKNDIAVGLITKALIIKPNFSEAHKNLGIILKANGNLNEAVASYSKALAINPDYGEVHFNLGNVLKDLGKLDEALASYSKALAIKPSFVEAQCNLGIVLQDLGRLDEALESFLNAIKIKPDYAEAHFNLGNVLKNLGKLDEALESYNNIIIIKPDYAEAHFSLGIVLKDLGQLDEAVASYNTAIAIKPNYAEAYNNLGSAFLELRMLDKAEVCFSQALNIKPNLAEVYYNRGNALNELTKFDEAVVSYNKAIAIKPDYVEAHYNLGLVLMKQGKLDDAILSFDLLQTMPSQAKLLQCLYELERYTDFYFKLDKLINLGNTNIRVSAISAFASQQLNRPDPHPFCKKPMQFIRVYSCIKGLDDANGFLRGLVDEMDNRACVWNPQGKATEGGFQSRSDLFINPIGLLADLSAIIWDNIENYRAEFSSQDCDFVKMFPKEAYLKGWFVRLKKEGHQTEHIHPDGWLSGVIYLKVPKVSHQKEGSIEFGLWGYNYPILDENYPRKRICPKGGDLVLFPSSLFHRTIPFHSDDERVCISFDLVPT